MKLENAEKLLASADAQGLRRALIVTALPLEMKAVLSCLKPLGSCLGKDGNVFEFGQFSGAGHEWLVIVGESGAGNHASQSIVTTAVLQFGRFELLLMIGVAASRKPVDAPIGSVVASNHVYLASVGKYENGEFYARAREFPVDPRLVGLSKKIIRDEHWHERLKPPYGGVKPDHSDYPKPFPPAALVAPVVSVESVSADQKSVLERQITHAYQDAIALEMEGYGVLFAAQIDQVPTIVIRGISDVREGKDARLDRIHQPIAAAHGAAFAFELLDLWGQNYPAVKAPSPTTPTPSASTSAQIQLPAPAQVTLVLNFAGTASDFPPEKQTQIVEALRTVTGNPNLSLVRTEVGSFHLFLNAQASDQALIDVPNVYKELTDKFNAHLLSVMTETEYRSSLDSQALLAAVSAPLLEWPQTLPDGTSIERPELETLLALLQKNEGSTTALLGKPGSGKTALLAKFAHALKVDGIPFLAIKADLLDPSVSDEEGLQKHLGLPQLPSTMLRRLSAVHPAVLIVDQLDALAGYVDLRTGRLSALLNLVRSLGLVRNIHIVLSARTFEFEHDARLKSVNAESITLELPPWSAVLQILNARNIKADGWPLDAQDEIRTPQSLATFLKLDRGPDAPPFNRYHAMLEELWQQRVLKHPNGVQAAKVAGIVAEDMAERETLWIASAKYDQFASELAQLVAVGILTHPAGNRGSIGFSHQTVFDFCLARAFSQREGSLSAYVLERESSLFVRPKLWSALSYLRDVEQPTYESELQTIWLRPNLRLHLRHLLIEFMGQQKRPFEAEAKLFEQALKSPDRHAALQAMTDSPGWFSRFQHTAIHQAMLNPKESNVVAGILARASTTFPEAVLAMVEQTWLPNKDFDGYAWHVLQECQPWTPKTLELASVIVKRTPVSNWALDYTLSIVGAEQPTLAIRLALARLQGQLIAAAAEAGTRASLPQKEGEDDLSYYFRASPTDPLTKLVEQSDGWDGLEALAKSDPANYLAILWPWFQEVTANIKRYKKDVADEFFSLPHTLDFRFEDEEDSLRLGEHPILGGYRTAAETLAAQDGDGFLQWLGSVENEDAEPAQRLFAHALASQPERYASRALGFLIGDKRRFHLGNMEDTSGTTTRLVKAVSPYWNDEQIALFVKEVLGYSPTPGAWRDAERRRYFYRNRDMVKLEILSSLPPDRTSPETKEFINSQRRRFGESTKRGAIVTGPQWIGSPMSSEQIGLASDEDVINAFEELPDSTGWDNPSKWMKGGNVQLSRAFADFAKTQPARAADIIRRFDPTIGTRAAGYALDAMAEDADPALILDLVRYLDSKGFAGEEFYGSAARALERLLKRDVPIDDVTLAIVERWLSLSPAPTPAKDASEDDEDNDDSLIERSDTKGDAKEDRKESVLWGMSGFAILPHGTYPMLEVLTRVLLHRTDYDRLLTLLTKHLDRDEDQKVWASMLRFFQYIRSDDIAQLSSFFSRLFKQYPGLIASREAAMFLAHAQWRTPDFVRSVLPLMKSHEAPLVQQTYGELATLIGLVQPKLGWPPALIQEILSDGSSMARTGAAYAAIHVWAETDNNKTAAEILQSLIQTADERTWGAVTDLFRIIDEIEPTATWSKLLRAYADQIPKQRSISSNFIVQRLQTLLPHYADLVADLVQALVDKWQTELADMQTSAASTAPELVDIAITLHRLGPDTRDRGTEIFEDLLNVNAYSARQTLDQIDNRFPAAAPRPRRRLPRRNRNPRRQARRAN
jgi:nucleoside phosphorylase